MRGSGGIVGQIVYTRNPNECLPSLMYRSLVYEVKNATFGLGQYADWPPIFSTTTEMRSRRAGQIVGP